MGLKHARLGRAENLDQETRQQFDLPDRGLVVIEVKNPTLREEIVSLEGKTISQYMKERHGDFLAPE